MKKIFFILILFWLSAVHSKNSNNDFVLSIKNDTGDAIHEIILNSEADHRILYKNNDYYCPNEKWCKAHLAHFNYKGNIIVKMYDAHGRLLSAYTLLAGLNNLKETKFATVYANNDTLGSYLFKNLVAGKDVRSSIEEAHALNRFMHYEQPQDAVNLFNDMGMYYKINADYHARFDENQFYIQMKESLEHGAVIDLNDKYIISATHTTNGIDYNSDPKALISLSNLFSTVTKFTGAPGVALFGAINLGLGVINYISDEQAPTFRQLEEINQKLSQVVQQLDALNLKIDELAQRMEENFEKQYRLNLDSNLLEFGKMYLTADNYNQLYLNLLRGDAAANPAVPSYTSLVEYLEDGRPLSELFKNPSPYKTAHTLLTEFRTQWNNLKPFFSLNVIQNPSDARPGQIFSNISNNMQLLCDDSTHFTGDIIFQRLVCNVIAYMTYDRTLQIINLNMARMVDEANVINNAGDYREYFEVSPLPVPWSQSVKWLTELNELYAINLTQDFLGKEPFAQGVQRAVYFAPAGLNPNLIKNLENPQLRCDDPNVESGINGLVAWYPSPSDQAHIMTSCQTGWVNDEGPIYTKQPYYLSSAGITFINRFGALIATDWTYPMFPANTLEDGRTPTLSLFKQVHITVKRNQTWDNGYGWGGNDFKFNIKMNPDYKIGWILEHPFHVSKTLFFGGDQSLSPTAQMFWCNGAGVCMKNKENQDNVFKEIAKNEFYSTIYPFYFYTIDEINKPGSGLGGTDIASRTRNYGSNLFYFSDPVIYGYLKNNIEYIFYIVMQANMKDIGYSNWNLFHPYEEQWADFSEILTIGCFWEKYGWCKVEGGSTKYDSYPSEMSITFQDGVKLKLSFARPANDRKIEDTVDVILTDVSN